MLFLIAGRTNFFQIQPVTNCRSFDAVWQQFLKISDKMLDETALF